jgi:hypothetical protein
VAESGRATLVDERRVGGEQTTPACAECRSGRTGRHLWASAAVPGHRLAAASWLSVPELVVPVRKACRSSILAESGERLAFRHDLIRDAEQASIPAAARALDRHGRQGAARPQSPVRRDCDAVVRQRESRDGKTNLEIAKYLFVSPHTVSAHLRHGFAFESQVSGRADQRGLRPPIGDRPNGRCAAARPLSPWPADMPFPEVVPCGQDRCEVVASRWPVRCRRCVVQASTEPVPA